MTTGQWRVLAILGVLLGVEIATSETTRTAVGKLARLDLAGFSASANGAPQAAAGFAIGAVVLIALAAWQEGIATAIALLFLLLVLINRADKIAPALQTAGDAVKGLTGKQGK